VFGVRRLARAGLAAFAQATAVLAMIAAAQSQTPQPAPAKAATEQPSKAAVPPSATVLDKGDVQGILGKDVRSAADEDMGRIVDVVVDSAGDPRAAVIDFGGFLGVGSRKIAVDWNALHFSPGEKPGQVTLDLTRDQVKAAPEYADKKPVVVLGASGSVHAMPQDEPSKPE
jgi:PRC-barrel domain